MSLVEIRPILASDIDLYWPKVAPLLQKAIDKSLGEFTIEHIHDLLIEAEKALWVVFRDGEIIAAITTRIDYYGYSNIRNVTIDFAGGNDFSDWSMFTDYIEPIYKELGCDNILIAGRLGWLRLHTDKGYKSVYHVIGKSLNG